MNNAKIKIEITSEELRVTLAKLIHSEHSKLISEIIIGNLMTTEVGLQQFYKALSGMKEVVNFTILDEVYIKYEETHTWRHDKDETNAAGLLFKDRLKGKITNIDLYKKQCLCIEYSAIKGGKVITEEVWMAPSGVILMEDFIE